MKKNLIFLFIAALVYACGGSDVSESGAETSSSGQTAAAEQPAVDGEKIYKQYCVACHGVYGDMGASGAFDLTSSELTVEERVQVITNGRNAMTPFKSLLSEEKIRAVAEYTMTLSENQNK